MTGEAAAAADYPQLRLHIDGEWLAASHRRTHTVVNPATGATLGELPLADSADLDRALDAANRGFRLWRQAEPNQRATVLHGAARLLRERADRVARIATLEEGKTLGLPISTDIPEAVHGFMSLFPQPMRTRPSVEYIPTPYPGGIPYRRGGSRT